MSSAVLRDAYDEVELGPIPPARTPRPTAYAAQAVVLLTTGAAAATVWHAWSVLTGDDPMLLAELRVRFASVWLLALPGLPALMLWTRRVHRNARAMGGNVQHADWLAWAGWLIPGLSLVLPPRIIARAHAVGGGPGSFAPRPRHLSAWWALTLVHGFTPWVIQVLDPNPSTYRSVAAGVLAASIMLTIAGLMLVAVVREVSDRQIRILHVRG